MGIYDKFLKILRHFYSKRKTYLTQGHHINQDGLMHLLKYLKEYEEMLIETTLGDFIKKIKELKRSNIFMSLSSQNLFEVNESNNDSVFVDIEFTTLEDFQDFVMKQQIEIEEDEQEITKLDADEQDESLPEPEKNPSLKESNLFLYEDTFIKNFNKFQKAKQFLKNLMLVKRNGQNYKKVYYQKFFGTDKVDYQVCYEYLHGLSFIFQYYQIGCPSWEYIYPYNLPPLLSDLYSYLKKINDNGTILKFNFQQSQPSYQLEQQLLIQPRKVIQKLPESIVEQLFKKEANLNEYYPEEYEIMPTDRTKEYTWHAELPLLKKEIVNELRRTLDWNSLPEQMRTENVFGKVICYKIDENSEIEIQPLFNNFDKITAKISVTEIENDFKPDKDVPPINFTVLNKNIFPTTQVFKNVKIQKEKKRDREIVYFLITSQTIKKYWEKINLTHKQIKTNKSQFPYRVYCNPIFSKLFLSFQIDKLEKQEQLTDSEYQNLLHNMVEEYRAIGILFENQDYLYQLKNVPVFHIDKPVFANISYNLGDPKLNIKTIEDKEEKKKLFMEIAMSQNYSTTFGYPQFIPANFRDSSLCLNLETGDMVNMQKLNWNSNDHRGIVLKQNLCTKNLQNQNAPVDKYILITPQILSEHFGLKLTQKDVFYLVLDNFTILTDNKQTSVLMLGDGFQLGLQFIRVLNLQKQQWLCCNDLVRFFPSPVETNREFDAYYETFEEQKNVVLKYNIYLSRKAFQYVREYFQENKIFIDFFKQLSDIGQIVSKGNNNPVKYRNLFKITEVIEEKGKEDPNIKLFHYYKNLVRKNYSNLKFHSCMSTFLEEKEVKSILQTISKLPEGNNHQQTLQSWDSFYLKYDPYTINILPKMQFKPQYHRLGDRVVFIFNSSKNTNFGQTGTITGIYKDKIEVIWDESVIGGTNLNGRCPDFRGGVYSFFDIFNLTQWPKIVISNDYIKEYEKCWEGDYDLKGLFEMAKSEEYRFFAEKKYDTKYQQLIQ